jgi:ABC-2 type transport system permease protein
VLFVLALSWLAAGIGLAARSAEAANSVGFALLFIPYVSTALVPAATMPRVLAAFARNQPFTPVIETMRGLWTGHTATGASAGHEALLAFVYCAAVLTVSSAGASWLFRHRTST